MNRNILFSTTRQWNPGDEFILMGCINLLKEIYPDFNPIIFNRNPEVRQGKFSNLNFLKSSRWERWRPTGNSLARAFLRTGFLDNSFKNDTDPSFLDLAVFAGSPEWKGPFCQPLYKVIFEREIPVLFLGIGAGPNFTKQKLSALEQAVLSRALLITARDENAGQFLEQYHPLVLPCPALLSATVPYEKKIQKVKKIGLIYGTYLASDNNNVSRNTYIYLKELYGEIIRRFSSQYEIEMVCHYIDELPHAYKDFPGINILYSYDSKDYLDIFHRFDFVIGHRVHGIGISASMGIPGLAVVHDNRGKTTKGFLAGLVTPQTPVLEVLDKINFYIGQIQTLNTALQIHKQNTRRSYLKALRDRLK